MDSIARRQKAHIYWVSLLYFLQPDDAFVGLETFLASIEAKHLDHVSLVAH